MYPLSSQFVLFFIFVIGFLTCNSYGAFVKQSRIGPGIWIPLPNLPGINPPATTLATTTGNPLCPTADCCLLGCPVGSGRCSPPGIIPQVCTISRLPPETCQHTIDAFRCGQCQPTDCNNAKICDGACTPVTAVG